MLFVHIKSFTFTVEKHRMYFGYLLKEVSMNNRSHAGKRFITNAWMHFFVRMFESYYQTVFMTVWLFVIVVFPFVLPLLPTSDMPERHTYYPS